MTNNEKFLEIYKRLENWCDDMFGKKPGYLIKEEYYPLHEYKKDVELIMNLRHVLVHNRIKKEDMGSRFITIHKELIDYADSFVTRITGSVINASVRSHEIYSVRRNDRVMEAVVTMMGKEYTHIPVVDNMMVLQGVFSENTLAKMVQDNNLNLNRNTTFNDIWDYISKPFDRNRLYDFVDINTSYCECMTKFCKYKKDGKRLDIIFITEDGSHRTPIRGLITTWDVAGK